MQKILIIEDDPSIRDELSLLLKNEGYSPFAPSDFEDVPSQAARYTPDLILLDINLPGRDGFSLCAELRKIIQAPIIFVTSRDSGLDEVRALSLGGDDYITKPYSVPVLLARIKAVLRRTGKSAASSDILEYGGLRLNLTKGTVSVNIKMKTEIETTASAATTIKTETGAVTKPDAITETKIESKTEAKTESAAAAKTKTAILTRNELQILACLMSHAGEIVSRPDLIEALWDNQIYIDDNTLSVNITRLRGKLTQLGFPDFIKTRRGMGYQL